MTRRSDRLPSWLGTFLLRYRRDVAIALALGFAASACAALLMFTSGYLISATGLAGTTLFSIMVPVAFVQLFGIGRPIARYLERLVSHNWVLRITSDLRLSLYRNIASRMGDPTQERATGEYLGVLADDVAHLQNLYLRVVFPSAVAYLLALGAALLFGFFSVPFALVILIALFILCVLLPYCTVLATRANRIKAKAAKSVEYASLADDVFGATDWVLSGRSDSTLSAHSASDARIREYECSTRTTQRAFSLISALALGALLITTVIWAAQSFGSSPVNANWIAAFALGFFPLIETFSVLPAALSEYTTHRMSVDRLNDYLADSDEGTYASVLDVGDGAEARIDLVNMSYAYPDSGKPALEGISLSIEPGQSVAIIGKSGSGKSTLAEVICARLAPTSGYASIAGSSLEGRTWNVSDLVGYLGQTPYLFNRSLRENLTLGAAVNDDEIILALQKVGLAQRYAELACGLDTVIGETGEGFSGGEAHRIALARILVASPQIIVLDEPFSALDPETEHDLIDTLFDVFAGRTLVVITHHLAQIDCFDRVILLEDGRIDLDGAPAQLMDSSERFRALVEFDQLGERVHE